MPRASPDRRPVRSQLAGPFVRYVRSRSGDADGLIRRHRLPADVEQRSDVTLPLGELRAFLDDAERASRDPFIGVHVAARLPRGSYGIVEYIARHASTIREVFRRLERYTALLNDAMSFDFDEDERGGVFRFGIPDDPLSYGRQANDFALAVFVVLGREVTGTDWNPRAVSFAHEKPSVIGELEKVFRCPLRFDAGSNVLELDNAVLELPVKSADPALLALLEQSSPPPAKKELIDEMTALLRRSLKDGPPRMGDVARSLALSERTLQRRLTEKGTTFQRIVEDVRQRLAREYLADGSLGMSEIAFLLGYSELSTFDRAFKRWTGKSPGALRARPG